MTDGVNHQLSRSERELERKRRMRDARAQIPRNSAGDPAFQSLAEIRKLYTDSDIVWLVNKALYTEGYQSDYHKKRGELHKELARALRERKDAESKQAQQNSEQDSEEEQTNG
jgi:hypothetical protein